jgi:hypothetical protein
MCSGHRVTSKTSLAARRPALARQWHPTLNGDLTPKDVMPCSSRKVWWQCPRVPAHVFQRTVDGHSRGHACPICTSKVVTPETSLAGRYPNVASGWHPTKNRPLTPHDVVPGSNRRVWWRCAVVAHHVFERAVFDRVEHPTACPYCRDAARRRAPRKRKRGRVPILL